MVQQTIKDINQSLVDDFLVSSDKIGAANFFWSFPSKAYQDQINIRDNLTGIKTQLEQIIQNLNEKIVVSKRQRCDPDRDRKLSHLDEVKQRESVLNSQLEQLKFNDPEEIKKILKQAEINREASNRWTDNIWTIKTFLTKKKGMPSKEADKCLKIDSSFDYINE